MDVKADVSIPLGTALYVEAGDDPLQVSPRLIQLLIAAGYEVVGQPERARYFLVLAYRGYAYATLGSGTLTSFSVRVVDAYTSEIIGTASFEGNDTSENILKAFVDQLRAISEAGT